MSITATELKNNLVNPHRNRVDTAKSLLGILPKDADMEESRAERLNK